MSQRAFFFLIVLLVSGVFTLQSSGAFAQEPRVGRKAAAKYFEAERPAETSSSFSSGSHVLMLDVGGFVNSHAYNWQDADTSAGRASYGITYLLDTWSSMDVNLRLDFNEYQLNGVHPIKLSILPLITFPMAETRFPIYFGAGAGPGIFFKQADGYSNLSLDYQLVVGVRFFDLYNNLGFFTEFGLKNHIHLTSGGQFNGTALTVGAVFTF
jgi:hypothetical protein